MAIANSITETYLEKLPPISTFIDRTGTLPIYKDVVYAAPEFGFDETLGLITVKESQSIRGEQYINHTSKAERQIATRLGLPSALPEKLRAIGAERELAGIFNKAVHHSNRDFMMRENPDDGLVFAGLTPSYRRMDNRHVLRPVLELLDQNEWLAKDWHISPQHTSINILMKSTAIVVNGENLIYGLNISNSEDGSGRLVTMGRIMRLLCSNGMMRVLMSNGLSMVHRGRRHRPGELDNDMDLAGILEMFPDEDGVYRSAMDTVTMVKDAMERVVPYNREEMLYGTADFAGATFAEREEMLKSASQYDESIWGYANVINHVAHQNNQVRNSELEKSAWGMVSQGLSSDRFLQGLSNTGHNIIQRLNRDN